MRGTLSAACLYTLCCVPAAASDVGTVEFTTLTSSDDLDRALSVSLLSPMDRRGGVYGVADLVWYRTDPGMDTDFTLRIALGAAMTGDTAPYLEIGTSLYDMLVLITDGEGDEDDTNSTCGTSGGESCRIDFNIKAGIRHRISSSLSINVFFSRIRFGNIDTDIEGNYDMFGAGMGYTF